MPVKRIAVVCGGYSGESVISFKSAQMVLDNLDKEKYEACKVILTREGWNMEDAEGNLYPIDKNDFSCALPHGWVNYHLAFIMIHGTPGEDGKLQGYFEMIGMPYTTGDVLNMALTFNKSATTRALGAEGFNVAKSLVLNYSGAISVDEIVENLTFPLFVKPNEGGSSLGISKVYKKEELQPALEKAHQASNQVIVEEFIKGKEFTCGCMTMNNKIQALHITEIESEKEFFDFDAKYQYDKTREITPARLPENLYKKCQKITGDIYRVLKCRGVIRVDYILREDEFYVIEVNTVPGMTEHSIVPQQAEAMGISKKELLNLIISGAIGEDN